jgi:hypothetical protein
MGQNESIQEWLGLKLKPEILVSCCDRSYETAAAAARAWGNNPRKKNEP